MQADFSQIPISMYILQVLTIIVSAWGLYLNYRQQEMQREIDKAVSTLEKTRLVASKLKQDWLAFHKIEQSLLDRIVGVSSKSTKDKVRKELRDKGHVIYYTPSDVERLEL